MRDEWKRSRRKFVKNLILSSVAIQMPWIQSCTSTEYNIPIPNNIDPLTKTSFLNLHRVLDILFPDDGNGPGATQLKTSHYFLWTVNDSNIDPSTRTFLLDKLERLNEEVQHYYKSDFYKLDSSQQEEFIEELSSLKWSKNWLSYLLTLTFESLILDAQYGVNPENVGWEWLGHYPGFPRPKKEQLYPTILKKKNKA